MAKKDNLGLLQEIVSQLRTLNRSSVRDQLREAETTKRAEKLASVTEENTETNTGMIDAATDFQRRFIAGQARTEFNSRIKDKPASRNDQEALYKLLDSRLAPAALADNNQEFVGPPSPSGEGSRAEVARAEREEMMRKQWLNQRIFAILAEQRAREQDQTNARFDLDPMNQTAEDARASAEALEELAHHATQSGSIFTNDIHASSRLDTLIDFAKSTEARRLKERNNDMRSARERRLEAIGGPGSIGAGLGNLNQSMNLGFEDDEGGEGFGGMIPFIKNPLVAAGLGAGGAFGLKSLWNRWGKNFFKSANLGKAGAALKNPFKWMGLARMALVYAVTDQIIKGISTFAGEGEESDTSDGSAGAGDPGMLTENNLWTAFGVYEVTKWIQKRRGVAFGISVLAKKLFSGGVKGTIRFALMNAARAAGIFVLGSAAAISAPVWATIIVAGIVAWKWEAITNAIFGAADIDGDASTAAGIDALMTSQPELFTQDTNLTGKVDLALDNAKRVNERRIQEMFSHLDKDQKDYAERIKQITDLAITGGYTQETIDRLIDQSQGIYSEAPGQISRFDKIPKPGDLMAGGSPNGRTLGMTAAKRRRLRNLANVYDIPDELSDTGDADRQALIQNYQNKIAQLGDVVTNTVTNHYYQNETHSLGSR